jgi:hypothetical protein
MRCPVADAVYAGLRPRVCRRMGISIASFDTWQQTYAGAGPPELCFQVQPRGAVERHVVATPQARDLFVQVLPLGVHDSRPRLQASTRAVAGHQLPRHALL